MKRTLRELERELRTIRRAPHGTLQCEACERLWEIAQELQADPRKGAERLRRRIHPEGWGWRSRQDLEHAWGSGYIRIGRH